MTSPPSIRELIGDAVEGAAVVLGDDRILGDVDQTAGQVTGVGGLQGGVGQTLTGTVGGDEVLQHRQALRGSWR